MRSAARSIETDRQDRALTLERVPVVRSEHLDTMLLTLRHMDRQLVNESHTARQQFVFPVGGVHYLHESGREVLIDLNRVGVIPAGRTTRERHPSRGDVSGLIVTVSPELLDEISWRAEAHVPDPPAGCATLPFQLRSQIALHRVAARTEDASALERIAFPELLIEAVRETVGQADAASVAFGAPVRLVRAIKEMIATSPVPLSLFDLAAELGSSPSYLTDLFRRTEGMPIHKYQMRLRLARGLRLLSTAEDLADLALELGFSSHSHFTAAFRAAYGVTPSAFRDSAWSGRKPPRSGQLRLAS